MTSLSVFETPNPAFASVHSFGTPVGLAAKRMVQGCPLPPPLDQVCHLYSEAPSIYGWPVLPQVPRTLAPLTVSVWVVPEVIVVMSVLSFAYFRPPQVS